MIRRVLVAFVCQLLFIATFASPGRADSWKQITEADGVQAWIRDTGDGLPLARASTTVDASVCEVLAVIRDIPKHCAWVADCVATRVLQRGDWQTIDMYLRIKGFPWVGVADRDAALRTVTAIEAPGDRVKVRFAVMSAKEDVLADDTVHMPRLTGTYELTRTPDGSTRVDYRFEVDLGGWVPGWIATRTVEELPWRTLVNLRKQVAETRGSYRATISEWPSLNGVSPCAASAS